MESFAGGRYTVERLLGRGGMAVVYLAHDRELDRPVAIKVLGEPFALDSEFARRFRREAQTAAKLVHPNIVQVFDAGEENGRLFIVMEYVDGEGLDRLLERERRLDPDRVLELAGQACSALQFAHEQRVIHRDVKPANLLLRRDGLLKVADFGVARAGHATELTQAGTILGTASYLAPEQARGEQVGPAADIYALGVVLYELFTGTPPWRIEGIAQLAAVGREPARAVRELAPEVPPEAEAAVMRCLARNPRHRPASAAELAGELGSEARTAAVTVAREPETPALDGPTVAVPHYRPARRLRLGRRSMAAGAAAAAAVAVAIIATLAALDGNGERASPARVERVRVSDDPLQQARNLEDWLRRHTAA